MPDLKKYQVDMLSRLMSEQTSAGRSAKQSA